MGQPLRIVTEFRGRQLTGSAGEQLRIEACRNMNWRMESRIARLPDAPERRSVARAMLSVEERLVKAFWVLARSTSNPGPRNPDKHGVTYLFERADQDARYKDAAAKNWESITPRPPVPSGREIDKADHALEWLMLISRDEAEIVSAGARSKNGDVERRVNWIRVRMQMPKFSDWSSDRMRRAYMSGLRNIAASVVL